MALRCNNSNLPFLKGQQLEVLFSLFFCESVNRYFLSAIRFQMIPSFLQNLVSA